MAASTNLVTCPHCGYPYPMTDVQREVYRGRNMGCMNCGRPFAVKDPEPKPLDPPSPTPPPAAKESAVSGDRVAGADASAATPDVAPQLHRTPPTDGEASAAAAPGAVAAKAARRAAGQIASIGRQPNGAAVVSIVSGGLFFLLAAASAVWAFASSMGGSSGMEGPAPEFLPTTPASILAMAAGLAALVALISGIAGLLATRIKVGPTGAMRGGHKSLAVAGVSLGAGGLVLGLFMLLLVSPVMADARDKANRARCQSNLEAIAVALTGYAQSHGGRYPDSLADLVADGSLAPESLVCTATHDTPAAGASNVAKAVALSQPGHASYVYSGKGLTLTSPADAVLAYEPLADHGDGLHVLFCDKVILYCPQSNARQFVVEMNSGPNPGAIAKLMRK